MFQPSRLAAAPMTRIRTTSASRRSQAGRLFDSAGVMGAAALTGGRIGSTVPNLTSCEGRLCRRKREQGIVARSDHAVARLGNLVPGSGEIAQRLRDDEPRFIGELVEHRIVRVLSAQSLDIRAEEERTRLADARVSERPDAFSV